MEVFRGTAIGKLALKNRFVRSATWEGMATVDGAATPELIRLMQELALGGAGLLIGSHAYVQKRGQASPWQVGLHDDSTMPGMKLFCEAASRNGTRVFAQLAHAGANADAALTDLMPLGPSETENSRGQKAGAMSEEDIARLVEDFGKAARRALEAGFDGIQIHAAHGYALSQFLSPFHNRRKDRYGGSLENRARLPVEVYRAVRSAVGSDCPITMKINADDFIDGGLTPRMMVQTALILENEGLDAIELSGSGGPKAHYTMSRSFDPKTPADEGYYRKAALLYKEKVKIPLMLVGGIRSLEFCERLFSEKMADMASMSRPFIREPGLVNRWAAGDTSRAKCISCEECRKPARSGKGIRCALEPNTPP